MRFHGSTFLVLLFFPFFVRNFHRPVFTCCNISLFYVAYFVQSFCTFEMQRKTHLKVLQCSYLAANCVLFFKCIFPAFQKHKKTTEKAIKTVVCEPRLKAHCYFCMEALILWIDYTSKVYSTARHNNKL